MQLGKIPLHKLVKRSGVQRQYRKGDVVQEAEDADSFVLITKGYVKRYYVNSDGSVNIQDIYGPGYFFPLTMTFKLLLGINIYEGREVYYYKAMTEVELCSLEASRLAGEVKKNPLLYRDLFMVSGRRLRSYILSTESSSLGTVYRRVAHLLCYLANEFGESNSVLGVRLLVPLTHADIAGLLNVARETVSRSLAQLQQKDLLQFNDGSIVIPNVIKLEAVAYGAKKAAN